MCGEGIFDDFYGEFNHGLYVARLPSPGAALELHQIMTSISG
jgi:hypothetical protein